MSIKIIAYSAGRSDIDRYFPILEVLKNLRNVKLKLVLSYIYYLKDFNSPIKDLNSFFTIVDYKNFINSKYFLNKDKPYFLANQLGREISRMSVIIENEKPDLLIVLGDRYEMIATPIAAVPFRIPVIHLYGGAVTVGAIDELIRHSITKLSHFHLVAHNDYKNRIKQLGEESKRIKTIYVPEIFSMKKEKIIPKQQLFDKFNFDIKKKVILVTYHPETLNQKNSFKNFNNILKILLKLRMQVIFTYPNSDLGHKFIINKYKKLCSKFKNFKLIKNAGQVLYANLLKNSDLMLGNSSSGIVEAASFKLPVINIGNRQTGKVRPLNVIDCDGSLRSLKEKISLGLSSKFKKKINTIKNPYEKKNKH